MRCVVHTLRLAAVVVMTTVPAAHSGSPPAQPSWPSPLPKFPSSWFGANVKNFELEDPKELAFLKQFTQVLASWPELVVSSAFTNGTAIAVEDAVRMKALLGPKTSVFTYQSMWVGAGFYDEVWDLMQDPEHYGGFFEDPKVANYTGYCEQVAQGAHLPNVTAESYPRCLGYYWNWCNETAADYFVNRVMRAMVADPSGTPYGFDGVFLDNSDNFRPPRGSKSQCDAAEATLKVHIALGQMFQALNKWPVFSFTPSPRERDAIWAAGVGFTKFYEYFTPSLNAMQELYNDTEMGLPTICHAPTYVKRHPAIPLMDVLAAFLVATGGADHSYFQYSAADWVVDSSWPWSPLLAVQYGKALGPPTITPYGPVVPGVAQATIWSRKFANGALVTVNCSADADKHHKWCVGNITGSASVEGSTSATSEVVGWKEVSVEDFGAKGDNETDNTKAFRAALLAIKAGGGEVLVPAGGVFRTAPVNLSSNVVLRVEGTMRALTDRSAFPQIVRAACCLPSRSTHTATRLTAGSTY
eukprot:SAG11_NODE_3570_length_2362_cov_5.801149_1_plen_527_part_00